MIEYLGDFSKLEIPEGVTEVICTKLGDGEPEYRMIERERLEKIDADREKEDLFVCRPESRGKKFSLRFDEELCVSGDMGDSIYAMKCVTQEDDSSKEVVLRMKRTESGLVPDKILDFDFVGAGLKAFHEIAGSIGVNRYGIFASETDDDESHWRNLAVFDEESGALRTFYRPRSTEQITEEIAYIYGECVYLTRVDRNQSFEEALVVEEHNFLTGSKQIVWSLGREDYVREIKRFCAERGMPKPEQILPQVGMVCVNSNFIFVQYEFEGSFRGSEIVSCIARGQNVQRVVQGRVEYGAYGQGEMEFLFGKTINTYEGWDADAGRHRDRGNGLHSVWAYDMVRNRVYLHKLNYSAYDSYAPGEIDMIDMEDFLNGDFSNCSVWVCDAKEADKRTSKFFYQGDLCFYEDYMVVLREQVIGDRYGDIADIPTGYNAQIVGKWICESIGYGSRFSMAEKGDAWCLLPITLEPIRKEQCLHIKSEWFEHPERGRLEKFQSSFSLSSSEEHNERKEVKLPLPCKKIEKYIQCTKDNKPGIGYSQWKSDTLVEINKPTYSNEDDRTVPGVKYNFTDHVCSKWSLSYKGDDGKEEAYSQLSNLSAYCLMEDGILFIKGGVLYFGAVNGLMMRLRTLSEDRINEDILKIEFNESEDRLYVYFMKSYKQTVSNRCYELSGGDYTGYCDAYEIDRGIFYYSNLKGYIKKCVARADERRAGQNAKDGAMASKEDGVPKKAEQGAEEAGNWQQEAIDEFSKTFKTLAATTALAQERISEIKILLPEGAGREVEIPIAWDGYLKNIPKQMAEKFHADTEGKFTEYLYRKQAGKTENSSALLLVRDKSELAGRTAGEGTNLWKEMSNAKYFIYQGYGHLEAIRAIKYICDCFFRYLQEEEKVSGEFSGAQVIVGYQLKD